MGTTRNGECREFFFFFLIESLTNLIMDAQAWVYHSLFVSILVLSYKLTVTIMIFGPLSSTTYRFFLTSDRGGFLNIVAFTFLFVEPSVHRLTSRWFILTLSCLINLMIFVCNLVVI